MSDKLKITQSQTGLSDTDATQDLYCASIGYPELISIPNLTVAGRLCEGEQPFITDWDVQVEKKEIDVEDLPSFVSPAT